MYTGASLECAHKLNNEVKYYMFLFYQRKLCSHQFNFAVCKLSHLFCVYLQSCDIAVNWSGGLHHAKKFEVGTLKWFNRILKSYKIDK